MPAPKDPMTAASRPPDDTAPLTVEHCTDTLGLPWIIIANGECIAEFQEEADARAFVALPALLEVLAEACDDEYGDTRRALGDDWLNKARAALAQADGPSPKE